MLFDSRSTAAQSSVVDADFSKLYLRELQQIPSLNDFLRLQIGLDLPQKAAYRVYPLKKEREKEIDVTMLWTP